MATVLSGAVMIGAGYLRVGGIIKFMPFPVTVVFTAGIAIIIFTSQIKDLLGLTLSSPEPGPLLAKITALHQALPSFSMPSMAASGVTIAIIVLCRKFRPQWPGMLIAVALVSVLVQAAHILLKPSGRASEVYLKRYRRPAFPIYRSI